LLKTCEVLSVSPKLSCGSNALERTRIGLRTGLKRILERRCIAAGTVRLSWSWWCQYD